MRGEPKKDKPEDKDLPGYPHYPSREDITQPDNNTGQVNFTEENITLPDVRDIPGQEYISPAPGGIMRDTTPSSADEEDIVNGDSLNSDDDEVKIVMGTEADITAEDLTLLSNEDVNVSRAALDSIDEDGEPLNEITGATDMGSDLDVPGSDIDDGSEKIGEEDEENNYYSLGSDDNDNNSEGTP
jgi:hypothetical protein